MNRHIKNQIKKCQYQVLMTVSLALLLSYPYMIGTPTKELLLDTLTNFVLLSALIAVSSHRKVLLVAMVLLILIMAMSWFPLSGQQSWQKTLELILTALFLAYVVWQIFSDVFSQRSIHRDTLFGAICIYLLLGFLWSYFYLLLVWLTPNAFSIDPSKLASDSELSGNLLYYSYTTLTTVGYGDITPVSLQARSIAIIEQITGVFYIAIMMARLVSMYQSEGALHDE